MIYSLMGVLLILWLIAFVPPLPKGVWRFTHSSQDGKRVSNSQVTDDYSLPLPDYIVMDGFENIDFSYAGNYKIDKDKIWLSNILTFINEGTIVKLTTESSQSATCNIITKGEELMIGQRSLGFYDHYQRVSRTEVKDYLDNLAMPDIVIWGEYYRFLRSDFQNNFHQELLKDKRFETLIEPHNSNMEIAQYFRQNGIPMEGYTFNLGLVDKRDSTLIELLKRKISSGFIFIKKGDGLEVFYNQSLSDGRIH